jgi:hypothetical protein
MTSVARTAKQEAAELLSQLPEDVSIEDIQYHLYVLDKIRRGRQAVEEGRIVSQQEARERMSRSRKLSARIARSVLAGCLYFTMATSALQAREIQDLRGFLDGKRQVYESDKDPKAKGLRLRFDFPSSWKGVPGKRPNVLVQVTSSGGKGLEMCNLIIKHMELPAGQEFTSADIDDVFSNESLRQMIPSGATFLAGKRTTIDSLPGAMVAFSLPIDRAGIAMSLTCPRS